MKENILYPNIEAERVRHGYTAEDFAALLGVTRKTIYNWLYKGNIPAKKIDDMAKLFNVNANYLLQIKQKDN